MKKIEVLILLGSESDRPRMAETGNVLSAYGIAHEVLVRSAHRMPEATVQAVKDAEAAGCRVFICAAGMAAHLAGLVAAHTVKPVVGHST